MKTINTPDWQAMAQPLAHTPDVDPRTLTAIRRAHAAIAHGGMFVAKRFALIDADGNRLPGTDPRAAKVAEELAGAYRLLSEEIYRLAGQEI